MNMVDDKEEGGGRRAIVDIISGNNIATLRFLDNDEVIQEDIKQLGLHGVKQGDIITIDFVEEEHYCDNDDGAEHEQGSVEQEVRVVTITVPPGAIPGEIIVLELDERTVEFVVPSGAKEGDEIEIRLEELLEGRALDDGDDQEVVWDKDCADEVGEALADLAGSLAVSTKDEEDVANSTKQGLSCDDEVILQQQKQKVFIEIVVPKSCVPGKDTLTFQSADGRLFSLPIPKDCSAGDILTVQLPDVPRSDDGKTSAGIKPVISSGAGAIVNVSETLEEREDGIITRTIVEEREDGTIVRTIETTTITELPDGERESTIETETIIEQPRKHKSLREKREHMLEYRRKFEEEEARRNRDASPASQSEKPKQKPKAEGTGHVLDADDFYAAGEIRHGGGYIYNHGVITDKSDENKNEGMEANPYQEAKPSGASEWYTTHQETKEVFDVETSRQGTTERSAACKQFEEDRAAVFDEDGNERPTPMLIIALEAAAIVHTRKAEGLNARLDALVAEDKETNQSQRCRVWVTK